MIYETIARFVNLPRFMSPTAKEKVPLAPSQESILHIDPLSPYYYIVFRELEYVIEVWPRCMDLAPVPPLNGISEKVPQLMYRNITWVRVSC